MADYSHLLSPGDAADRLGVTRSRLNQIRAEMRAAGEKFGTRIGSHWFYTAEELDAYRATHDPKGGRPPGSKIGTATPAPGVAV
jgi:hypothetical protein